MFKKIQVQKISSDFRDATRVVEVPIPTDIPEKHVLIKLSAVGVNASDINLTAGRYFSDAKVPFDAGFEGLGTVEKTGPNTDMKVGQAVVFMGLDCFTEYALRPEAMVVPIPVADKQFIGIMVCGLTAAMGLDYAGCIKEGDKVLITAAAGGTGQVCVQWAKLKGCHVIGTCSTPEKEAYLKELGCDKVINYKTSNLDEVLSKDYPDGVDVIWETIGGETFKMLFHHLAVYGRLVTIGAITGYSSVGFPDVNIPNLTQKLMTKSLSLKGFFLKDYGHKIPEYLPKLIGLSAQGKLKVQVDTGNSSPGGPFNGIDDVVRAVEYLHSGKNCGKVVVPI